jgi:uncharacterized delta-60 repeat protein
MSEQPPPYTPPLTNPPAKKTRRWPWIILAVVGSLIAISALAGTDTTSDSPAGTSDPSAVSKGIGSLDTSFSEDGKVTTRVTRYGGAASAVAIQANGKIIVAGVSFGPNPRFALARYRKDGRLNAAFGGDGGVTTDFTDGDDGAGALAIQSDRKIVAAGYSGDGDFALARYNTDGTLDPTFGPDGKVTTDFAEGIDTAYAVGIQADGKILVAGGTYDAGDQKLALARYNTDGTLDPTFGEDGKVIGLGGFAFDIAIQADGKILTSNPVARYNADGTLDSTFGGLAGSEMAIQPDGKIVASWVDGECFGAGDCDYWFVLERSNAYGARDSTFGEKGEVIGPPVGQPADIATQSEGEIVVATGGNGGFVLVSYLADGTLDSAFGRDGIVFTNFTRRADRPGALAIQDDGKIVAIGTAGRWYSERARFAVARYLP